MYLSVTELLEHNFTNWDPNKFNWHCESWKLAQYASEYFEIWWDPERFDWSGSLWALAEYCRKYAHIWLDLDRIDNVINTDNIFLIKLSGYLNSEYFKKIWNPRKFNWIHYSYLLAECCSDKFKIWWNPIYYNWKSHSYALAKGCYMHFERWWNPWRYNYNNNGLLYLCVYCKDYIDKWWNPEIIYQKIKSEELRKISNNPEVPSKIKLLLSLVT